MEKMSIVIPFVNEGEEIYNTIKDIYRTAYPGTFEIIAVEDDRSGDYDFSPWSLVKHLKTNYQRGTPYCRDLGVKAAKYDCVFMLDAHMRFRFDDWLGKICERVIKEPTTIGCTKTLGLSAKGFTLIRYKGRVKTIVYDRANKSLYKPFVFNKKERVQEFPDTMDIKNFRGEYRGATIKMFETEKDGKDREPGYRNIVVEKWTKTGQISDDSKDFFFVPIIMGGNYFFSKRWYQKLRGFEGLEMWGNIQSFLSLKSWMFGGQSKCLQSVAVGHKFRDVSPHYIPYFYTYFNKLYTILTLFPYDLQRRIISWLSSEDNPEKPHIDRAWGLLNAREKQIKKARAYYDRHKKFEIADFFTTFDIETYLPS